MDNTLQQALLEQRYYPRSGGRLSVYREEVLVLEREGCPFKLVLEPERVVVKEEQGERGVALGPTVCPRGFPARIWRAAFAEIRQLLSPGIATGPWEVESDGITLKITHRRSPNLRHPKRVVGLSLIVGFRYLRGHQDPRWILGFAYFLEGSPTQSLTITYAGPCDGLGDTLTETFQVYALKEKKYRTFVTSESPVFLY